MNLRSLRYDSAIIRRQVISPRDCKTSYIVCTYIMAPAYFSPLIYEHPPSSLPTWLRMARLALQNPDYFLLNIHPLCSAIVRRENNRMNKQPRSPAPSAKYLARRLKNPFPSQATEKERVIIITQKDKRSSLD